MFSRHYYIQLVGTLLLLVLTTLALISISSTLFGVGSQQMLKAEIRMHFQSGNGLFIRSRMPKQLWSMWKAPSPVNWDIFFFLQTINFQRYRLGKVYRHHWDAQTGSLDLFGIPLPAWKDEQWTSFLDRLVERGKEISKYQLSGQVFVLMI